MTLRRKQNIQLAIVGGILLAIILMTVFAPWLAPYDPLEVRMEDQLLPPCLAHPLGTDALGRDVLSRVIYGGRASLLLAVLMAVLLLPAEALAITGGEVQRMYMNTAPATVKKEGVDDGSQIYSLKMNNGKLVMFIATSGPHMASP